MAIEITINGSIDASARYLSYTPSPCRIRLINEPAALTAQVRTETGSTGKLAFYDLPNSAPKTFLNIDLPADGTPVEFWIGGEFGSPSSGDRDTVMVIRSGGATLSSVPLMIRVRKNANTLTPGERDRFVAAFAQFNNQGIGGFKAFRDMHTNESDPEAHGGPGFLPWHRTYLLDLERELQAIDASISLHYWRFDAPAPNLFHLDFIGVTLPSGRVQFGQNNPLQFWTTDGSLGVLREPLFNTATQSAFVLSEAGTLALGGDKEYASFRDMERNPHGNAHMSFSGSISAIHTAAKDPLFFMLHCNVDRLWAKWQWINDRFDANNASAFETGPHRIGHNLADSMWPWNGIVGAPRPSTAPGGSMANSPLVGAPGAQPVVSSALDFQGRSSAPNRLGMDYDDVPFD